ncbi:MAG: membrane protein insertion efficiency factor YidD [Mycobacteriales bacterium]
MALVRFYRAWFAPLLGPRCRFEPSCSTYALEALTRHGLIRGSALTVWRLLRCQPFGTGGLDPVPPRTRSRRGPGPAACLPDPMGLSAPGGGPC